MLARLCSIPGIADARVECSGSWFLIAGAEPGALERALPAVFDVLGPRTRRVDGELRDAQLARRERGELWFTKDDIRGLSYVEARILARRLTDMVIAAVNVDAMAAERVHEAVLAEIFATLDQAHDTGGRSSPGWFWKAWPGVVGQISTRLEGVLSGEVRHAVAAALRAQGNGG